MEKTLNDHLDQMMDEAFVYERKARELSPSAGSLAVGAADFDEFIRAFALRMLVFEVKRRGVTKDALDCVKEACRSAVRKHNSRRPDVNWKRSESTVEPFLMDRYRRIARWAV